MEERQQLPNTGGSCEGLTAPEHSAEEDNSKVAFLSKMMAKVALRGDLDYAQKVAEDVMLAALETGEVKLAQMLGTTVANLRQQQLMEKQKQQHLLEQQKQPWPQKLADQFNLLFGKDAAAKYNKEK